MGAYNIDLTKSVSSFTRQEQLLRFVWSYLLWPLLRYLPRTHGSKMRIVGLRAFGAKIGPACLIEPGVMIWLPWRLELDGYVAIGRAVEIYNYGWVRIGRMSVVSQYCYICTGSHDYSRSTMPLIWRDIVIGSECWVAAGVFVAPGVVIGDGSVIGACSVVTKSMPGGMICAGNPCRPIKPRPATEP